MKHMRSAHDESEQTAKEKTINISRGDIVKKGYYSSVPDDDTILDLLVETETVPSLTPQPVNSETMPSVTPQPAVYCPLVSDISSCDDDAIQSLLESFNLPSPEDVKIFVDDFELEHFDSGIVITEEIVREVLQPNGDGIQLRSGRRL